MALTREEKIKKYNILLTKYVSKALMEGEHVSKGMLAQDIGMFPSAKLIIEKISLFIQENGLYDANIWVGTTGSDCHECGGVEVESLMISSPNVRKTNEEIDREITQHDMWEKNKRDAAKVRRKEKDRRDRAVYELLKKKFEKSIK